MTTYTPKEFESNGVYTKQYTCDESTYVKNDWTRPAYICAPKKTKQEIYENKHNHLTKKQIYAKIMKYNKGYNKGIFRSSLYCINNTDI